MLEGPTAPHHRSGQGPPDTQFQFRSTLTQKRRKPLSRAVFLQTKPKPPRQGKNRKFENVCSQRICQIHSSSPLWPDAETQLRHPSLYCGLFVAGWPAWRQYRYPGGNRLRRRTQLRQRGDDHPKLARRSPRGRRTHRPRAAAPGRRAGSESRRAGRSLQKRNACRSRSFRPDGRRRRIVRLRDCARDRPPCRSR